MRQQAFLYSAGLHLALLMFAFFGLPELFERHEEPRAIVVSIEPLPIKDISNVKPQERIKPKEKIEDLKPQANKPAPPVKKDEPKEKEAVKTPQEKKPEKKPEKKKPEKKPEKKEDKPEAEDTLEDVLKDLAEKARSEDSKEEPQDKSAEQQQAISDRYDPSIPLSISEKDAIIGQFIKCWRVPAGAVNDYELRVTVKVLVREDGQVLSAELSASDRIKAAGNPYFRAAADAALRAVHKCNPLQNLPTDKYSSWKDMELTFDPKYMLY